MILAGLSLALNLLAGGAYIGSTYFATHRARSNLIDRHFADLARKLGVDPGQDPGIMALHRAVKVALDVRHIRSQPVFEDIMTEFAKPEPDPARIQTLQDQVTTVRRQSGDETLAALIAFLDQATPEERGTLLGLLKDHKNMDTAPIRFGLAP
jgi:hypothetical protein